MPNMLQRLSHGEVFLDLLSRRVRWYKISAVILIICIIGIAVRGLSLGIEFTGGAVFQVTTQVKDTTVDDVRDAVTNTDVPDMGDIQVTTVGGSSVRVQTRTLEVDEVAQVRQAIADEVQVTPDDVAYNLIGASWGKQITQQGLVALGVFLVLVMLLITVYFRNWMYSIAAIVAVLHDLIVTVGVYAIVGFSVTPTTLIGVLTILGYSLYDTMVVFDKTRENTQDIEQSGKTFTEHANTALNQVLVRSINTTIIAILPVIALLFAGAFVLGTGPLKDLSLALFVGMIAGAYSSIFIATSLLVEMTERRPEMAQHRERLAQRRERDEHQQRRREQRDEAAGEHEVAAAAEPTAAAAAAPGERRQPRHLPRSKRRR